MESGLRIVWVMLVAAASGLALSCGGGGGGTGPGGETGQIQVTVTLDGSNATGVVVRLFVAGGSSVQASQPTGANGRATFQGLTAGGYDVEVEVPEGSELTAGSARRGVTVQAGATATVAFALAATGDVVEVLVRGNLTFSPSDLTIEPGTTVRWRNEVAMLHTITPEGHSEWAEGSVSAAGDVFTHTFQTTGSFPYHCVPHLSDDMTGVVTVQ